MKKTSSQRKYKKISDLLTSDRRWCKGKLENNHGRYCLIGAVYEVYKDGEYSKVIDRIIKNLPKEYYKISTFNDDPKTTFKDVEKLIKKLNI